MINYSYLSSEVKIRNREIVGDLLYKRLEIVFITSTICEVMQQSCRMLVNTFLSGSKRSITNLFTESKHPM